MQLNNNNQHGLSGKAMCALFLCLSFFSFSLSAASIDLRGFNFSDNKTKTVIPFKLVKNLIVIPAKINTDLNVNLVFDTGVRSLVLFGSKFKQKLPMTNKEAILAGYGKSKSKKAAISVENDVFISDVEGHGISILVAPGKYFFPKSWELPIHGLIGYQIFSRFVVQIDYPNGLIVLSEPDQFSPSADLVSKSLLVKDTKPYIPMSFELGKEKNEEAYFHIDTGSSRELILFLKGDRYKSLKKERCYIGKGISGGLYGFRAGNASIGLLNSQNIAPEVHLLDKEFSDRELAESYGTIGSGLLKDYVIIFDYVHQRFYIKEPFKGLLEPKLTVDIIKHTG